MGVRVTRVQRRGTGQAEVTARAPAPTRPRLSPASFAASPVRPHRLRLPALPARTASAAMAPESCVQGPEASPASPAVTGQARRRKGGSRIGRLPFPRDPEL